MLSDPAGLRSLAVERVRHFGAHIPGLQERFPDLYPRIFVSGKGVYLTDTEGHRVIDGGNHLGVCSVGHANPEVVEAITNQLNSLEFSSLEAGASHVYVIMLADVLRRIVPVDDAYFSFTSSGSEANELAIKVARDYFRRAGQPERTKILTRRTSYHGSSYAAMTATRIPAFRESFLPLNEGFVELPQPFPGFCGLCNFGESCTRRCLDETRRVIEDEGPESIAAIIAEPVSIPGAVKVPPSDYWFVLRSLCDEYGILLVSDEVVCGFGRTGSMFGVEDFGVRPDMMTMAKALTGGYVPMGALAVSGRIQQMYQDSPLPHVNTYAGHPLGCAAALAVIDIIEREHLVQHAKDLEGVLRSGLEACARSIPWRSRVSVKGLISSIELLVPDYIEAELVRMDLWNACYVNGVALRVTRAEQVVTLLFYPPLIINPTEMDDALDAISAALEYVTHAHSMDKEPSK